MSKKEAKAWLYRGEVPKAPAFRARAERLNEVLLQLRALSDFDFSDVVLQELDWRRLDQDGNPKEHLPPGLDVAAFTAVIALLSSPPIKNLRKSKEDLAHKGLVERIAAVARGVEVRSMEKGTAPVIREVARLVEGVSASPAFPAATKATAIAKTLSKRFQTPITPAQVETALQRDWTGTVADLVIVLGLGRTKGEQGINRNKMLKAVAEALLTDAERAEKQMEREAKRGTTTKRSKAKKVKS